ncbi:hypothetical protein EPUS_07823 [Endocarpon pusillum Z07020]|uniref:Uncharacterized protein n=1 Tax=Endocarpon pusillum (strain Z07020 / HMAS-L-300199) TaxID=1263415 RepID=U1G920_ENDPU|nr:uncharacterized protein EPUS_07823 [Endocarpon pusillum Z07020]ERF73972.1 hypothetical protein EPUS_07823 [Endocarpon pusillum Z07020]
MAEKNVSGPPVPTARSPKPVSEALLNEKVREASLPSRHTNQRHAVSSLLPSFNELQKSHSALFTILTRSDRILGHRNETAKH